jgi:hypothetical protein
VASTEGFISIDEDPTTDSRLATRNRTVNGVAVKVPEQVIADGDEAYYLKVNADGSLNVTSTPDLGDAVVTGKPTPDNANRFIFASADASRRSLWVVNNHTSIVLWMGDVNCDVGQGIPVYPGYAIELDGAPKAQWYCKPSATLGAAPGATTPARIEEKS